MLRRTGFGRHEIVRTPQPLYAPVERRGTYTGAIAGPAPKTEIVRSEAYRRLVADMPCIACGCGPCQAAHPNTGKGMGLKTDDRRCFPLCGPVPGRPGPGCHALFDQGAMFSKAARRAIEPAWGADTRRRIIANGLWPANVPQWED